MMIITEFMVRVMITEVLMFFLLQICSYTPRKYFVNNSIVIEKNKPLLQHLVCQNR